MYKHTLSIAVPDACCFCIVLFIVQCTFPPIRAHGRDHGEAEEEQPEETPSLWQLTQRYVHLVMVPSGSSTPVYAVDHPSAYFMSHSSGLGTRSEAPSAKYSPRRSAYTQGLTSVEEFFLYSFTFIPKDSGSTEHKNPGTGAKTWTELITSSQNYRVFKEKVTNIDSLQSVLSSLPFDIPESALQRVDSAYGTSKLTQEHISLFEDTIRYLTYELRKGIKEQFEYESLNHLGWPCRNRLLRSGPAFSYSLKPQCMKKAVYASTSVKSSSSSCNRTSLVDTGDRGEAERLQGLVTTSHRNSTDGVRMGSFGIQQEHQMDVSEGSFKTKRHSDFTVGPQASQQKQSVPSQPPHAQNTRGGHSPRETSPDDPKGRHTTATKKKEKEEKEKPKIPQWILVRLAEEWRGPSKSDHSGVESQLVEAQTACLRNNGSRTGHRKKKISKGKRHTSSATREKGHRAGASGLFGEEEELLYGPDALPSCAINVTQEFFEIFDAIVAEFSSKENREPQRREQELNNREARGEVLHSGGEENTQEKKKGTNQPALRKEQETLTRKGSVPSGQDAAEQRQSEGEIEQRQMLHKSLQERQEQKQKRPGYHVPEEAKQYVYALVPGLFTEYYPGYFDSNIRMLQMHGMEVRRIPMNTVAAVLTNAQVVADYVLRIHKETGKKVILIGHSKGGVDIAAALARNCSVLCDIVAGHIAVQVPYGGATLVHDISRTSNPKALIKFIITKILKGDFAAFEDLGYESRKTFVKEYPYPVHRVPTLSLATSMNVVRPISSMIGPIAYVYQRYRAESDGLVSMVDAVIPGSLVVYLTDMDHAGGAFTGFPNVSRYNPGEVTLALICLFFKQFAVQP